ncbi:hypothetical protein HG530_010707 [Fusarium avenaceum]|nr:hypothetical protein HG530_010707 [Fusarium avenaceum]
MEASRRSDQDSEAIIRACTYHRHEFDRLLVQIPKTKLQAPFLQTSFKPSSPSGLGILGRLPDELVLMILRELDIVSYLRFRGVNSRARSIATNSKDYKTVVKYGMRGLKALLKVRLGHVFTITGLQQVVVSHECEFCGKFATFLYLITCQRCCFTCLQISSELRTIPIPVPKEFVKAVKKTAGDIEGVCEPKSSVVHGKYSLETWPRVIRPKRLAQARPAIEKLQSLDGSRRIPKRVLDHLPEHQVRNEATHHYCYRYMAATALPCPFTSGLQVFEHDLTYFIVGVHLILVNTQILSDASEGGFVWHDNSNRPRMFRISIDHGIHDTLHTTIDRLQLLESNVFTAEQFHKVLDTINDPEVTISIKLSHISSFEPPIIGKGLLCFFVVVEVPNHDRSALDQNFALGDLGISRVSEFWNGD